MNRRTVIVGLGVGGRAGLGKVLRFTEWCETHMAVNGVMGFSDVNMVLGRLGFGSCRRHEGRLKGG